MPFIFTTILWGGYYYSPLFTHEEPETDEMTCSIQCIQWWSRIWPTSLADVLHCCLLLRAAGRKQTAQRETFIFHLLMNSLWPEWFLRQRGNADLVLSGNEMETFSWSALNSTSWMKLFIKCITLYTSCCLKEQIVGIMQVFSDGCDSQAGQWGRYSFCRSHCTKYFAFTL